MLNSKITIIILLFLFGAPLVIAQSCFSDAQCINGGAPFTDGGREIQSKCVNGQCEIVQLSVRDVECARDDDCPNGFICDTDWTCLQIDKYADTGNQEQYYGTSDNNVMTGAIILGIAFVIGMIILGLIIRRKKKN